MHVCCAVLGVLMEKTIYFFNLKPGTIDHREFKCSAFDDDRQPEITKEAGNTYIVETITAIIESRAYKD